MTTLHEGFQLLMERKLRDHLLKNYMHEIHYKYQHLESHHLEIQTLSVDNETIAAMWAGLKIKQGYKNTTKQYTISESLSNTPFPIVRRVSALVE